MKEEIIENGVFLNCSRLGLVYLANLSLEQIATKMLEIHEDL